MSESYFGKCGMCIYCDLYNKNGSHFKCAAVSGRWVLATEKACNKFESDSSNRSAKDIDYAREHTKGLA
ncbi:MAG: hypothetical protein PUH33_09075 [Clostridiaceae bacterium]|nr:hypothetical protein [Clostridiaceae bacterium]